MKVHPNTPNSRQIKGESYKEIDRLQIGDLVLSANEHTGELSYQPVTELFVHDVKLIHRLTYKEGLTIETTWNHPFWVQDKGWTEAKDLHAGERSVTARSILKQKQPRLQTVSFTSNVQPGFDDPSLLTWDDAQEGTISVARVEEVHRADKVYNIEVEGNHTYFVTEEGVLVHNYAHVIVGGVVLVAAGVGLYILVDNYLDAAKDTKEAYDAAKKYRENRDRLLKKALDGTADADDIAKFDESMKEALAKTGKALRSSGCLPGTACGGPVPTSKGDLIAVIPMTVLSQTPQATPQSKETPQPKPVTPEKPDQSDELNYLILDLLQ